MQGVIKSYDPGTGDGVVVRDTDLAEYRPGHGRARGLRLPHAPPGPAGRLRPRRRRAGHPPPPRLRGRHGHARASPPTGTLDGRVAPIRLTRAPQSDRPARLAGDHHMTATTSNQKLDGLGRGVAEVFQPDDVHWCDGSGRGVRPPVRQLVDGGTFTDAVARPSAPTATWPCPTPATSPGSRTAPSSAPSRRSTPAPPTTGGRPAEMKAELLGLYRGAMKGRTMYVVPFSHGPARLAHRPHRRAAHRLALRRRQHADHDPHGPGRPRRARATASSCPACTRSATRWSTPTARPADVPWPCDAENKYISTSPRPARSGRYGSGYGGNALLGKKCFALRIASTMARDEGWMAEHMLILGVTTPEGEKRYVAAAFPSACGKTNMAMLIPTLPGWKVETVGDDIAWMKFGDDGRLYAINPEAGFFGVAPGTGEKTNPNAIAHPLRQLHLHQRRPDRRRRHLVGGPHRRAAGPPHRLEGQRLDARVRRRPAAHPNARFTAPASQCPSIAPEWEDPDGRADLGHPLRRPPGHQRPARHRGLRLAARRVPRLDHELGEDRRRRRHRRRGPLRPLRHAALHGLQRRRLHGPLARHRRGHRRRQAAQAVLGQLVPQGRRTASSCGPASARTAGCSSGSSSGSRAPPTPSTPPSAGCPTADALDTNGLDVDDDTVAELLDGRQRGLAGRDPADRGATSPSSASASPTSCATSSASSRSAWPTELTARLTILERAAPGEGAALVAAPGDSVAFAAQQPTGVQVGDDLGQISRTVAGGAVRAVPCEAATPGTSCRTAVDEAVRPSRWKTRSEQAGTASRSGSRLEHVVELGVEVGREEGDRRPRWHGSTPTCCVLLLPTSPAPGRRSPLPSVRPPTTGGRSSRAPPIPRSPRGRQRLHPDPDRGGQGRPRGRGGHAISGITSAEGVTGSYDVIARAEADTVDDLGKMVVSRVQLVDGITRTVTCPVVHL